MNEYLLKLVEILREEYTKQELADVVKLLQKEVQQT